MKRIAFEEHFTTQEHLDLLTAIREGRYPIPEVLREEKDIAEELLFLDLKTSGTITSRLLNIGEGRIREMNKTGIDMQVLSLVSPGVQVLDAPTATKVARKMNDTISAAVKKFPTRFAGLATIAPHDPNGAADELERAVKKLSLKGVIINSHTKGEYLDGKKFWPIFETAEKLNVPIYLHPRIPSPGMRQPYLDYHLDAAILGYSHEVALHAMRIICAGVFDKYPNLKIILGHLGESLPYWLWRLDNKAALLPAKLKKKPSEYIKENFYVTTSGLFCHPPLICAYLALGAERILFAVDYPLEETKQATKFIETAPISDIDKEKICHGNTEKLLGI